VIGLYKAKCVRHEGPVRTVDDLKLRTLTWVHWFNQTRLHGCWATSRRSSSSTRTTIRSTPHSNRRQDNSPCTEPGAIQFETIPSVL
jgi:Integrase core domain